MQTRTCAWPPSRIPLISEDLLRRALGQCAVPEFFEEVYAEARWYFREPVRESIQEAPGCPADLSRRLALASHLVAALERGAPNPASLRRIVSLFTQLEEGEYQFVTYWAKRQSPQLLRVVKYFYDRLLRQRSGLSSALPERGEDGRWATLEERVFLATQATQEDQIIQVLKDPDPQVFRLALENPALTSADPGLHPARPGPRAGRAGGLPRHLAGGSSGGRDPDPPSPPDGSHGPPPPGEPARPQARHRDPAGPPAPAPGGQAPRPGDPPHPLLGMDVSERITALRASGGELMRHLPQEVLQDEETLRRMVSDRQLDPGILLRLARNKLTPRAVLEQIASHPVLLAHAAIMSELLLNPKTPAGSLRPHLGAAVRGRAAATPPQPPPSRDPADPRVNGGRTAP